MAYQKQVWENLPSTNTPISADRLNHMEDGIYNANEGLIEVHNSYSTSTTEPYSANYVNNNFLGKEYVLYNDIIGTNGNITLSDSSTNYTYIEVFYKDTAITSFNSTKIYQPDGKRIELCCFFNGSSGNTTQFRNSVYSFSGTSMTLEDWHGRGFINNGSAGSSDTTNELYVTRIVGYK